MMPAQRSATQHTNDQPAVPAATPGRPPHPRGAGRTRRGGVVLACLLTVGAVAACEAPEPIQGSVIDREHTKRHQELQHTVGCGTELNGKYSCGKPKTRWVTEPEKWELTVEDSQGQTHEVRVTRAEYDAHPVGSSFVEASA